MDIQGLRAVAVGLILLYHAGVPFLPGGYVGVDVFFVISGFLITGLIVRELRETQRLDLARFYARRARRLLPATAIIFVAVAAMTLLILPVTRWAGVAGDTAASALYVVNWRLAARSVDYLASEAAASPLQHFWSLAIEEQFYIIWPLLLVLLLWVLRRPGRSRQLSTKHLAAGISLILVPSLLWSVHLTSVAPSRAYLVTTTRLWELAVGGLLAVVVTHLARIPQMARMALGWVGLLGIAAAAVFFDVTTPFPGFAALLPTLGAAAILVAGASDGSARLRFLDLPVMQEIGALSYSLYLWHWPFIVGAAALWARPNGSLSVRIGMLAVGISAIPAYLSYRFVEKPLHGSATLAAVPRRAAAVGLVCVLVGLACAFAISTSAPPVVRYSATDHPGALVLRPGSDGRAARVAIDPDAPFFPAAQVAAGDNPDVYSDGCHQNQADATVTTCVYGDPDSQDVVALVGDSHAAQWEPALRALAEQYHWRLETHTKSACLFADVDVWDEDVQGPYESCSAWVVDVLDLLAGDPPDVVVTSGSGAYARARSGERVDRPEADAALAGAMARTWQALSDEGIRVVVLIDTPLVGIDVPECLAEHPETPDDCSVMLGEAADASAGPIQERALSGVRGVDTLNLTDYICPGGVCAPVIGNVLVWRDRNHLTATYSRSLAPLVGPAIQAAFKG
jgi:peptidoglycan/LPS O-acetylase OafA/YrhL